MTTTIEGKTISAVASEYEVSARTLRFYEERGLLTPDRIGTQRSYRPQDEVRLKIIIAVKEMGFSLGETHGIIARNEALPSKGEPLVLAREEIETKLGELMRRREAIENALCELKAMLPSEPSTRPVEVAEPL